MAKTVEIDETQLLATQGVVQLVNEILANPEGRKLMHEATKKARPNAVIPELEAKQEVLGVVADLRKELADERAERLKEKQEREEQERLQSFTRSWDQQKESLRQRGWMDDGLDKVETFAKEHGIVDLTIAADAFERRNPPPEPVMPSGALGFDIFNPPADDSEEMKKLLETRGDDPQALNSLVNKALTDVRSSGGRR